MFASQWALMIAGFGLLSVVIAPAQIFPSSIASYRYLEAVLKAIVATVMSIFWLFVWDRQVRFLFYRRNR